LHAETDAEIRDFVFAGILDRVNHSLESALTETSGNQDAVVAMQSRGGCCHRVNFFGLDPFEDRLLIVSQSAMKQRFTEAFVGVFELNVLAHYGDADFAARVVNAVDEVEPRAHVGRPLFQFQMTQNLRVETLSAEFHRNGINRVDVFHGNDAGFGYVAEERDFFLEVAGNVAVAAAKQNVRLNPDAEHLLNAVLCGLGLQFACRGDEGHQRHVNEERVFRAEFQTHLSDGFEEGKRFNVADRAADLDDDNVHLVGNFANGGFNLVGDVWNDLHRLAEIITAAFLGQNRFVDAAGGPVIVAGKFGVSESLVVAEVEVGFRAVFGDKDFTMLKRTHRAWIDVQVRIAFLKGDFETATFEETTDGGSCNSLSK